MSSYFLSIRWAGYHLLENTFSEITEQLPCDGMQSVNALTYRGPDVFIEGMLDRLMPMIFEEDGLVALDPQGRVLARGRAVWECEDNGCRDGVYLGVSIPHAVMSSNWTEQGSEITRGLCQEFGQEWGNWIASNILAFIERVGELEDQGLRPLVHLGGFNYGVAP